MFSYCFDFIKKNFLPKKFIVLDTETTGLGSDDEILQFSVIDNNNCVLVNNLYKPEHHVSWDDAYKIHKISPMDVKDKPIFKSDVLRLKKILNKYPLIVGYNVSFDLNMLKNNGLDLSNINNFDCYLNCKKNFPELGHSLGNMAQYFNFNYDNNAHFHDALTDCKATKFIYLNLLELEKNELSQYKSSAD